MQGEVISLPYASSFASESNEGGLELGQLLGTIRRRWLLIVGTTAVVTVGTFFWSITRPAQYQGQFQILVEPVTAESEVVSRATGDQKSVTDQDLGETQQASTLLDYSTQIEVLYSRKLLDPVVNRLQDTFPEITYDILRRKLQISRQSGSSQGQGRGEGADTTKILLFEYQSPNPEEVKQVSQDLSQTYVKYSLQERQTNLRRAIQFTDKQLPLLKAQVNQLELQLQQFRERNRLVDPEQLSQQVTSELGSFQQQLMSTQLELLQKKRLYASLQEQLQLQPDGVEASSVLSQAPDYRKLVEQLQELETQLEIESAQLTADHPVIIDLKSQRDRLLPLVAQRAKSTLGSNLYEKFGDATSLPYQNELRQALGQQLVDTALEVQALEARARGTEELTKTLETRVVQLPKIAREHEALERQLAIATDNLQGFMKTREELLISAARQEVPWELIEPPTQPGEVALADLPRDLSLGSFLGLILGLGLSILIDKASKTIHGVDELRSIAELPILGKIPLNGNLDESVVELGHPVEQLEVQGLSVSEEEYPLEGIGYGVSPFLEAFRSLSIQLQMLRPDSPIRSLVVSSSMPEEGKSTVASHLAKTAASMGKRVLLVDADLRVPSVHSLFSMEQRPGLSELTTMDFDLETVIQPSPHEEGLFVLTSGTQPSDPTRFLASQKMHALMDSFLDMFDLVIYDTPPLGLSETVLMSTLVDGLLLVTKLGLAKHSDLKETLDKLRQSRVSVLGFVANGVKTQASASSAYGKYMNG
ncbi:Tyrosine-protein kinase YwqD [Acaryochloris thomasi RCC1774]|uniref:Tyrosine-protein kinase YwqD n=2 Tax=Acaryochloris TaxID=155977 RepID=A0A2W1JHW6_9CYAN|nr:Tyrosine-protein kinase YwqD [Acaryochloris thomasi RCC1774]